jgi:hypothetical protein
MHKRPDKGREGIQEKQQIKGDKKEVKGNSRKGGNRKGV